MNERKDIRRLLPPDKDKQKHISIVVMQPKDFSDCRVQLHRLVELGAAFIRVSASQQDPWKNVLAADFVIS